MLCPNYTTNKIVAQFIPLNNLYQSNLLPYGICLSEKLSPFSEKLPPHEPIWVESDLPKDKGSSSSWSSTAKIYSIPKEWWRPLYLMSVYIPLLVYAMDVHPLTLIPVLGHRYFCAIATVWSVKLDSPNAGTLKSDSWGWLYMYRLITRASFCLIKSSDLFMISEVIYTAGQVWPMGRR